MCVLWLEIVVSQFEIAVSNLETNDYWRIFVCGIVFWRMCLWIPEEGDTWMFTKTINVYGKVYQAGDG